MMLVVLPMGVGKPSDLTQEHARMVKSLRDSYSAILRERYERWKGL